jgi:glycogen(starch) synthase
MVLRVLYWAQAFWPEIGGTEILASHSLPALQEMGYEFAVLASSEGTDLPAWAEYRGIPIHRLPFRQALASNDVDLLLETLRRAVEVKRRFKPDVIHVDFTDPGVFFHLRTTRAHAAPWVLALHGGLMMLRSAHTDTLMGQALHSAHWVTACSAAVLGDAHRLAPEIATRSSVVHGGLPMPDLVPAPLPAEPPRLLCLGRAVPQKGFDLALHALARLADRFPDAVLTIAGDGAALPALQQEAALLGVAQNVRFVGWVAPQEVPRLINDATLVIVPSRFEEGLSLVAVEAAQMARPVVATRVGGLAEAVAHGQTGVLVEPEDVDALAEAIGCLLAHPDAAASMGLAGRRRAAEVFGLRRYVEAYDSLYRRIACEETSAEQRRRPVKQEPSVGGDEAADSE